MISTKESPSTPKSNKANITDFSPVSVRESPVNKAVNLTGNARKVRDCVADLFNLIQEWNTHHITGSALLRNISDLKLPLLNTSDIKDHASLYSPGLQLLCDQLDNTCFKLKEVVQQIEVVKKELGGITKLEKFKVGENTPLFLTWPSDKFEESCEEIVSAYRTELNLKFYLKENVAHCTTKETLMFHVASWVHQPYIDQSINLTLEAMLKETGHR